LQPEASPRCAKLTPWQPSRGEISSAYKHAIVTSPAARRSYTLAWPLSLALSELWPLERKAPRPRYGNRSLISQPSGFASADATRVIFETIRAIGWLTVIAAVAVAGYLLFHYFAGIAANDPGGTILLLVVIVGLGSLAYFFLPPRGRGHYEKPGRYKGLIVPALILFGLSGFGAISGYDDRRDGWLYYYCAYGSVSQAQLGEQLLGVLPRSWHSRSVSSPEEDHPPFEVS
jgi:hypothetical protein